MRPLPRDVTIFYDSTPFNVISKDFFCIIFPSGQMDDMCKRGFLQHIFEVFCRVFFISIRNVPNKLGQKVRHTLEALVLLESTSRIGNQSKRRRTPVCLNICSPFFTRVRASGKNHVLLIFQIAFCLF